MIPHYGLAMLCQSSYCDPERYQNTIDKTVFYFNEPNTDSQAYMFIGGNKTAVIAVRGTESLYDVETDIKVKKRNGYHRGFYRAAHELWAKLSTVVLSLKAEGYKVALTGHSLGGAIAVIIAAELFKPDELVTFGQPRVASRKRLDLSLAGVSYVRYINKADIVPHLPLRLFNYGHAGELRYISTSSNIHIKPSYLFVLFDGLLRSRAITKSHSIAEYIKEIFYTANKETIAI